MIELIAPPRASSALPATFRDCKRYTRHHAKSFYFSSFMLPKHKRLAAYAVYAFCRYADDVIDRAERVPDRAEATAGLHRLLDQVYSFERDDAQPLHALGETVQRYDIPRSYFGDLIDGVTSDLETKRYRSFPELYEYCYKVAGVVGLIMSRIFGYSHPVAHCYAEDLGTAMQLTNILRDIREDAAMGRVYLPQQELAQFSYSEEQLRSGVRNDAFRELMQFQVERARMYYRRSAEGIGYLTDDGSRLTVAMMNRIYSGILDEIERNAYDVYSRRHRVHLGKKLWMYATHRSRQSILSLTPMPDAGLQPLATPTAAE
jgi:15-cis-phytoene synthase